MSSFAHPNARRGHRRGRSNNAVELFTRPKHSLPAILLVSLWRWRWELTITTAAFAAHASLVSAGLTNIAAIALMTGLLAVALAIPHTRSFTRNRLWCVIVRHRLRVCMNELRTLNYSGNAALILSARGTKEGESLWLWMRPGLSIDDLEKRTEAIAAACWARDARVSRSIRLASLVRVEIIRRNPLARADIKSPLLNATHGIPGITPTGDLAVRLATRTNGTDTNTAAPTDTRAPAGQAGPVTTKKARTTAAAATPAPVVLRNGEDVSDYV